MVRFRLTPAERRARFSEGRWGWANPKRMTRKEFIGLRDRMYREKKKMKEAAKARHTAMPAAGALPMKKKRGLMRWLILLIIIGAAVYFYLKKIGRI